MQPELVVPAVPTMTNGRNAAITSFGEIPRSKRLAMISILISWPVDSAGNPQLDDRQMRGMATCRVQSVRNPSYAPDPGIHLLDLRFESGRFDAEAGVAGDGPVDALTHPQELERLGDAVVNLIGAVDHGRLVVPASGF